MKEKDNLQNRKEKYFKTKSPTKNSSPERIKQLNIKKKTKIPNRKWAKDLNEHFMKKVYTWPLNT